MNETTALSAPSDPALAPAEALELIAFWREAGPDVWFAKGPDIDPPVPRPIPRPA